MLGHSSGELGLVAGDGSEIKMEVNRSLPTKHERSLALALLACDRQRHASPRRPRPGRTQRKAFTMDLLFPDDGLVMQLTRILTATVKYHLYTNNYTPDLAATLSSVTEASWTGYAAVSLTDSNYTITGVTAHNGYAIAAPISFSNTSGSSQNAYGYYVTDSSATKLLAIARFDSAPLSIANGSSAQVVPVWGDFSQLSS